MLATNGEPTERNRENWKVSGQRPSVGHPLPREWNRGHGVGKFQLPEGLSHQYAQISPSRPGMASHRQDLVVVPAVGLGAVSPQVNQASEENQWQKKITCKDRYCVPIYKCLVISAAMALGELKTRGLKSIFP